jgi:hypothetical protein
MKPRNRIPRSHWDHGIRHKHFCQRFVEKIEIIICKVLIPWSQWDCGNQSCCLIGTAGYMTKIFNFIYVFLVVAGAALLFMSDPTVSMRPRDRFLRSQWDRGIRHENFCHDFRGHNETPGLVPRSQWDWGDRNPRSQWDHWIGSRASIRLRKFYDTARILTKTNIGSHSL